MIPPNKPVVSYHSYLFSKKWRTQNELIKATAKKDKREAAYMKKAAGGTRVDPSFTYYK